MPNLDYGSARLIDTEASVFLTRSRVLADAGTEFLEAFAHRDFVIFCILPLVKLPTTHTTPFLASGRATQTRQGPQSVAEFTTRTAGTNRWFHQAYGRPRHRGGGSYR